MARVNVSEEIAAPAATVCDLVGNPAYGARWPVVERCEVEGEGPGCIRTLQLLDGSTICERLDAIDPAARTYGSTILEMAGLPIKKLEYRVSVSELGPERCRVDWEMTFQPSGISEDRLAHMLEGIFTSSTTSIRDTLGVG